MRAGTQRAAQRIDGPRTARIMPADLQAPPLQRWRPFGLGHIEQETAVVAAHLRQLDDTATHQDILRRCRGRHLLLQGGVPMAAGPGQAE